MHRAFFLVLAAPLCLVSACAGAVDGRLVNSTWRIVMIDGASAVSPDARLAFAGDDLSASAGCNHMGGKWRNEGDRLIAGQIAQTEMWCENEGLMRQEQALGALLTNRPEYKADGDRLTLFTAEHSAEARRVK